MSIPLNTFICRPRLVAVEHIVVVYLDRERILADQPRCGRRPKCRAAITAARAARGCYRKDRSR